MTAAEQNTSAVLATDGTLRGILELSIGGVELLDSVGAATVRKHLDGDPRFVEFLGPPQLRPFIEENSVREMDLRPAANLLARPDFWLEHIVNPAVLEAMPPEERRGMTDLVAQLAREGVVVGNRPLLLPPPGELAAAVAAYVATYSDSWSPEFAAECGEVLNVLAPTRYRTRACYVGKFNELRAVVLASLAEASGAVLPPRLDRGDDLLDRNWERLCALAGSRIERIDLSVYPRLRNQVRVPQSVRTRRQRAPRAAATPSSPFRTLRHVMDFLEHHVTDNGCLPARDELDDGQLFGIERIVNSRYQDFKDALHSQDASRFPLPRRSANERELDNLLTAAFADRMVPDSFKTEWSDRETFGSAARIDTYFRLTPGTLSEHQVDTVEVFAEADGQGHFQQVHNFTPLEQYRQSDLDKALALHRRWETAHDLVMLNVHHRLLSGPPSMRLTAEGVARIVAAAHNAGHWWVFVRPVAVDECRAAPGGDVVALDVDVDAVDVLVPAAARFAAGQLRLALG